MYPTIEEVEKANKIQLGRWYRYLPSPKTEEEAKVINLIFKLFMRLGGWTPELSKIVG